MSTVNTEEKNKKNDHYGVCLLSKVPSMNDIGKYDIDLLDDPLFSILPIDPDQIRFYHDLYFAFLVISGRCIRLDSYQ